MKKVSIKSIPFVRHVGIIQADNNLSLEPQPHLRNHLNTLHASAQFALAETGSGAFLQELFPEPASHVTPVLRDSQMKFRKPATTKVTAYPVAEPSAIEKFQA